MGSRSKLRAIPPSSAPFLALLGSLICFLIVSTGRASAHESAIHGLILATVPKTTSVVMRYDSLAGRPAGISTFRVEPKVAFASLRIGMSVDATADIDETPWTLSRFTRFGTQALTGSPAAASGTVPTQLFRNVHHVAVGEYVPAGAFLDQTGHPFTLRDFRGQTVVLAFVYTRCRDARECPLISSRFRLLQERLRGAPAHLVLVTLDPAYDTPRVLAAYGTTYGTDPKRWSLATGDPEKVLDFAAQFDVTAFPDERIGLIHPERLVIVDAFGAIRELVDEGSWTPDEVVAAVRNDERLGSNPVERLDLLLSSAAVSVCGNAVAGFSGFTDLLTVIGIVSFFGYLFWRIGRGIARGTT